MLLRVSSVKSCGDNYLLFCLHHIISDGISGLHFVLNTLRSYNCNDANSCVVDNKTTIPDNIPFYPIANSAGDVVAPDNVTKIRTFTLSDQVPDIKEKLRQNSLSMTAYLSACVLLSMKQIFKTKSTEVIIGLDLRKNGLNVADGELEFLASCFSVCPLSKFHDDKIVLADLFNSEIKKQRVSHNLWSSRSDLCDLINNRTSNDDFARQFISRSSKVFIGNCGNVVTEANADGIAISEIYFFGNCQSYMGTGNSLTIHVGTMNMNKTFCAISYPHPLINEDLIVKFQTMLQTTYNDI